MLRDIIIADSDEEAQALWANSATFAGNAWFVPFGFRRGMLDPKTGEAPSAEEAIAKGYALVGCNSAGNNAFFVHRSCMPPDLAEHTAQSAYVACSFREARDEQGRLQFLSPEEEIRLLSALPTVEVEA